MRISYNRINEYIGAPVYDFHWFCENTKSISYIIKDGPNPAASCYKVEASKFKTDYINAEITPLLIKYFESTYTEFQPSDGRVYNSLARSSSYMNGVLSFMRVHSDSNIGVMAINIANYTPIYYSFKMDNKKHWYTDALVLNFDSFLISLTYYDFTSHATSKNEFKIYPETEENLEILKQFLRVIDVNSATVIDSFIGFVGR